MASGFRTGGRERGTPNKSGTNSLLIDLVGQRFGKLVVLHRIATRKPATWLCRCECGIEKEIGARHLRAGKVVSCGQSGCRNVISTHKRSKTPEFRSWASMLGRCLNPRDSAYSDYGGRGITVCDRWQKFENFYADMGDRPPGYTLDRIDNDGSYEPENCRWADKKTQARNRRSNTKLMFRGETKILAEWAESLGIHVTTLLRRIRQGLNPEEIFR